MATSVKNATMIFRRWFYLRKKSRPVHLAAARIGQHEHNLAMEFAGLRKDQLTDKVAVAAALGRLLRRALVALMNEERAASLKKHFGPSLQSRLQQERTFSSH